VVVFEIKIPLRGIGGTAPNFNFDIFDLGGVLKAVPLTPVFILMAGTHLPKVVFDLPHPPHTSIKEHKNTK